MFRHLKCHHQGARCALLKLHTEFSGLSKVKLLKYKILNVNKMFIVQRDKRFAYWLYMTYPCLPGVDTEQARPFITPYNQHLIEVYHFTQYFNNFTLLGPENLCVILARHNKLPEDDILNVETCRSMLFVIIMFDIIVQSLDKIVKKTSYLVSVTEGAVLTEHTSYKRRKDND